MIALPISSSPTVARHVPYENFSFCSYFALEGVAVLSDISDGSTLYSGWWNSTYITPSVGTTALMLSSYGTVQPTTRLPFLLMRLLCVALAVLYLVLPNHAQWLDFILYAGFMVTYAPATNFSGNQRSGFRMKGRVQPPYISLHGFFS